MEDKQYIEIITKLTEISADVKGVHRRQDITNGRIAKNEEKVIDLEKANISILDKLDQLKKHNDEHDVIETDAIKSKSEDKQYWVRKVGERILWASVAVVAVILTKLGIININL